MCQDAPADKSKVGHPGKGPAELGHIMAFIQSIDFATDRTDEMLALLKRWTADATVSGTAQRATLAADRAASGRYVLAVAFESPESAAANSNRSETGAFADQFAELCSDAPTFREFDLVEVFGS